MKRQEGESCVSVGERLEVRGTAWTWKQGGNPQPGGEESYLQGKK